MSAFHHGLRHRLVLHLGIAALATGVGAALLILHRPETLAGPEAAAAAGIWLHVPAFLMTAFTLHAVLEGWPLWGREREGAALLVRLPAAQRGMLAAAAGMLVRLAVLLACTGVIFGTLLPWCGAPTKAFAHLPFLHSEPRLLTAAEPQVQVNGPDEVLASIRVQATVFAAEDADYAPVELVLVADGVRLSEPIVIRGSRELVEVKFTPRRIGTLTIARSSPRGTTILLEQDAVVGVAAAGVPVWVHGACAAVTYAFAGALIVSALAPLHGVVALPLLHLATLVLLLLSTISGFLPHADSIVAFARNRWLLAEPLTGRWLACLFSAMALSAVTLRAGVRRSQ